MNNEIQVHDTVALLEDVAATHFLTGEDLMLRRGQVGTIVMAYDGSAFEVEFSGRDGRAYPTAEPSEQPMPGSAAFWPSAGRASGR